MFTPRQVLLQSPVRRGWQVSELPKSDTGTYVRNRTDGPPARTETSFHATRTAPLATGTDLDNP
jgi:hypothetical protein